MRDVQITFKVPKALATQLEAQGQTDEESRHVVARRLMEAMLHQSDRDPIAELNLRLDEAVSQQSLSLEILSELRSLLIETRRDLRTTCFALMVIGGKTEEYARAWVGKHLPSTLGK